jgi:hypothetical protein
LQQVTLQVGSLNVNPAVPTKTLNILAAPIEFFVKSNLNRSLITAITASLKSEFAAPTPFSQANTFPNSNYLNFPTDTRALLILKGGYPWEYRHFPFPVAGFMDQWLNTYGAIFGFILVLLTTLDHIGFRKFIIKLQNARVRSADKYIDHLIESMQTRSLTNTEIKHLSLIEKWVNKQALDAQYLKRKIDGIKE